MKKSPILLSVFSFLAVVLLLTAASKLSVLQTDTLTVTSKFGVGTNAPQYSVHVVGSGIETYIISNRITVQAIGGAGGGYIQTDGSASQVSADEFLADTLKDAGDDNETDIDVKNHVLSDSAGSIPSWTVLGTLTHSNTTSGVSYLIPIIQAGETNLTTATTATIVFAKAMPTTNYSVCLTPSVSAIVSPTVTTRTTTSFSTSMTAFTGRLMWTITEQTQ